MTTAAMLTAGIAAFVAGEVFDLDELQIAAALFIVFGIGLALG